MNDKIYPLAWRLPGGQTCTLHYLGFPEAWKAALFEIERKHKPRYRDEYGLPTNALKKLLESWMEEFAAMAPLKKDSRDAHWLTSCRAYSEKSVQTLCSIIKVWVTATYITSPKTTPAVKTLAREFCGSVDWRELMALRSSENVRLTLEDGTVCGEAYQAVPLMAVSRLAGKDITLYGRTLHLCYTAKNQLVSSPLTDPKSRHQYSFVFDLSVQTTPPKRKALLLCQMSIRRWVPDTYNKERLPYLPQSINAHIRISEDKYCQLSLSDDRLSRRLVWEAQDRECYDIWGYEPLPQAEAVVREPAEYAPKILLPHKNGMSGFTASKIGTGVSVMDKASLYRSISVLLGDMVSKPPAAERVTLRGRKIHTYRSPQEYESAEDFRNWVSRCAETDRITFELYGLWDDETKKELLGQLKAKLERDFGEQTESSCLNVRYLYKEAGSLADAMQDDRKQTKITRCEELVRRLGSTDGVTACLFVLPGPEKYEAGDPKSVLRNAFARTGRVVQFIVPEEENGQNKIDNAVYDLYRQLGVVTLLNFKKPQPVPGSIPCVGMHLCTQVQGISNKGRFLPVCVTVDLLQGRTRVQCDAFSERTVSYREACLEMAQLFWKTDLEQRCVEASRAPAKQKLIELKNRYDTPQNGVLVFVRSDGNTRAVWGGISDKEIGGYSMADAYCPAQLNAGTPKNAYPLSLANSGVRIIRIRSNQEVPDYFTAQSSRSAEDHLQFSSASGIFRYEDVYWGIHARPNDSRYTRSFKESRVDHPRHPFAEKDMIELYPLQLQPGDNAAEWISHTNALRAVPIQYNQSTVLPLPLHLAGNLEEYLFKG